MATKGSKPPALAAPASIKDLAWDTEERHDLFPKEGRIRDNNIYLTVGLSVWMEQEWGGVLTHVITFTDVPAGEVSVFRAMPDDPGAVQIRRLGAQNVLQFNFWRPLKKLNLKVPADRQYNVKPFTRQFIEGTVFVFPMNARESISRNSRDEADLADIDEVPTLSNNQ